MERQRITPTEDAIITRRDFRDQLESDIIQQVTNEIEDTLLQYAPTTWSDERNDDIEQQVLDHTRTVLTALSAAELQSDCALQRYIGQAVAETRRVIHQGGVRP